MCGFFSLSSGFFKQPQWADSFIPPYNETISSTPLKSSQDSAPFRKIPKMEIRKQIRDALIRELVSHYEKLLANYDGILKLTETSSFSKKHLIKKDSKVKSVLEYLVEKRAVKKISKSTFESFRKVLGGSSLERILRKVEIINDEDEMEEEMFLI